MKQEMLELQFVERFPLELSDGVLYISMIYGTAAHNCCCGCGRKVITPFGRTDWKLLYDGESVSLHPSIGNWSFPCQSHYWIWGNAVKWAPRWTREEIEKGRARDRQIKDAYFSGALKPETQATFKGVLGPDSEMTEPEKSPEDFWSWLWSRVRRQQ